MKDVIERLTKLSKVGFGYDITFEDREALKDAVEALSASPAGVKPLEWEWFEDDGMACWIAHGMGVTYEAGIDAAGCAYWGLFRGLQKAHDAETLEAAKSAAYEDYKSRILSALE